MLPTLSLNHHRMSFISQSVALATRHSGYLFPRPPAPLPRSSSYIDYSALPYAHVFVHFPPSPTLTSTHAVDSPMLYDRSPIFVDKNDCQLPSRGSRRVEGQAREQSQYKFAIGSPSLPMSSSLAVPFIHDDSGTGSSSDDSDAYTGAGDAYFKCHSSCSSGAHHPLCRACRVFSQPGAPPFLPSRLSSSSRPPSKPISSSGSKRAGPSRGAPTMGSSCLEGF